MIKRPHSFNEVIGHDVLKRYFQERIKSGTLPQFLILEGPEGLGKTSMAEIIAIDLNYGAEQSPQRDEAVRLVIDERKSIDCIAKYNMAKDSGKDTAKEVLESLNANMSSTGRKVVICDESHAIREDAQDVFLVETESLPKNVYLIMCTTKKSALKSTLLSRAAVIPLNPLTTSAMVKLLEQEVSSRGLTVQGGSATLRMIAEWADNKPRAALNILNAFGDNGTVTTDMVHEFIGYMDMSEVLPLIASLGGSMTYGLGYIGEMRISDSLVDRTIELLRIKLGQPSYKMSVEDFHSARRQLENVPEESIIKFLHGITMVQKLTRSVIISSYVSAHVAYNKLVDRNVDVRSEELAKRTENMKIAQEVKPLGGGFKVPSIEDLIADSDIVGE